MNGALLDRRWLGGALLTCLAAALAALTIPVHLPQGSGNTASSSALPADTAASAPEDLGVFLDVKDAADHVEDARKLGRGQPRRRPAAEEDRPRRGPFERAAPVSGLALHRLQVAGDQTFDPLVGVEVAVRALRLAERNVDVEREGHVL